MKLLAPQIFIHITLQMGPLFYYQFVVPKIIHDNIVMI